MRSGTIREALFGSLDPTEVRDQIEHEKLRAKKMVDVMRGTLSFTMEEIGRAIIVNPRTIERRITKRENLNLAEGDRIYRIARIADLATEMLGDADAARRWLRTPIPYLGGETPLAMVATEIGTQLVEQSLYAIGYGGLG